MKVLGAVKWPDIENPFIGHYERVALHRVCCVVNFDIFYVAVFHIVCLLLISVWHILCSSISYCLTSEFLMFYWIMILSFQQQTLGIATPSVLLCKHFKKIAFFILVFTTLSFFIHNKDRKSGVTVFTLQMFVK